MALDQEDIATIADVVQGFLGTRLEEVYGAIEQLREEFRQTVTEWRDTVGVLDGNDTALLGELRKLQSVTPAEVLKEAGESWERFIRGEAAHLGLRVVKPKKVQGESDAIKE